jgi:tetratricopeptide (TPR) repeat protein
LRDNPGSAQAARDVSVSLNKLADFLAQRGQPGDAERALAYFQRDLEISEQLLRDNPGSAQAARDVSVSLNKLADFLAQRGQPGDAERALAHYQRCQDVLEQLLRDNPGSAATIRDVVVSHYKLAGFGMQHGNQELAVRHLNGCFRVLHAAVTAGMTFDPPIMGLYQQLQQMAGGA